MPSATKLRRLCFYRRLSVHRGWGCLPQCMLGYHPPPRSRHTPLEQTHPWSRHPPGAGTPREQTPPGSRHTPPGADTPQSRHPLQNPPRSRTPPLEIQSLLRTVHILLECILVRYFYHRQTCKRSYEKIPDVKTMYNAS